jgi:hypothetical protein
MNHILFVYSTGTVTCLDFFTLNIQQFQKPPRACWGHQQIFSSSAASTIQMWIYLLWKSDSQEIWQFLFVNSNKNKKIFLVNSMLRIRIRYPVPSRSLPPGSGMDKKSGSGTNYQDHNSQSFDTTLLGLINSNSLMRIRDSGWPKNSDPGSGN